MTLAEHFGGRDVTKESYARMIEEVSGYIAPFAADHGNDLVGMHLLGTSGTVTTLAGIHLNLARYDRRRVDGIWMEDADLTATGAAVIAFPFRAVTPNTPPSGFIPRITKRPPGADATGLPP